MAERFFIAQKLVKSDKNTQPVRFFSTHLVTGHNKFRDEVP
jgi:hypothetical protein